MWVVGLAGKWAVQRFPFGESAPSFVRARWHGPCGEAAALGEGGGSSGAVGKRHQTQEGVIQQKLRDNFKHLGPSETDVVKGPDGRALRERLQHDF